MPLAAVAGAGGSRPAGLLVALLALGPASDLAIALVNRAVTQRAGSEAAAAARPRRRRADRAADARRRADAPHRATRTSRPRSAGSRSTTSATATATFGSPCSPTGSTPPTEQVAGDDELLAAAVAGIDRLNERHGEAPGGGARFLLFHRRRTLERGRGRWMGWERKRGKLEELNALLRGSTTTGILTDGRAASTPPTDVRYVVTLDADTRLPAGRGRAPRRHDGPPAQPADASIAQRRPGRPRATASSSRGSRRRCPAEHEASLFQRIFSGSAGIDPYASAVSDVYQDLFGEGSFTGKGIYDVDAFDRGDGGPRPRERAAQPRPVRGHLRPGRPGDRRRAVRRVPVELPGRGGPPAPLGPRRLAAPALDPRPGARRHRAPRAGARSRASPAGRWSTTCAARCPPRSRWRPSLAAWTLPVGPGRPVDRVRPGRRGHPGRPARRSPDCCRDGRASRSAATFGPSATTSPSPRPTWDWASPSSPTRRG